MIRLFTLAALGAAAITAAAPATAASDVQAYAACVAKARPRQAAELLNAQTAAAASDPYRDLAHNDYCFSRVFTGSYQPQDAAVSIGALRGHFAEKALLADPRAAALQPLPLQQKRYLRPWFAATGRHPAVDEMAACMADTDPAAIMGLIRTAPGSWDENSWMGSMPASLTKCLSAGVRLDASRPALRAALADALYQRVHNPALSLAPAAETAK